MSGDTEAPTTHRYPTAAEAIEEAVVWAERSTNNGLHVSIASANARTAQAWATIALAIQAQEGERG